MKPVAYIENDYNEKFAVPRQSGLVDSALSRVVFEKEYSQPEAFRGIEDFSHLWLIWEFSQCKKEGWRPTVRPPKLGGNKRMGVFATRSPYRPNSIGLSAVALESLSFDKKGRAVLTVRGADLMNGTPVLDVKPYLPFSDSIPSAVGGFTEKLACKTLEVELSKELLEKIPEEKRDSLIRALSQDPRPAYHKDSSREYGFVFGNMEIGFTVNEDVLRVTRAESKEKE